jgi:putative transport protein
VKELIRILNDVPLAGLMMVVAAGFTLGRLRWRGLSPGPAGGTLVIALLAGSAGLSFHALYGPADPLLTVGQLGFALFIYSVGFEAGPRFFSAFRGGPGWRFVALGGCVVVVALGLSVALGRILSLGEAVTAGLLSGALTSAPTYAAAAEVCIDQAALAVSFALTYPIGLVGVVLLVQFLPRLLDDDLAADAEEDGPRGAGRGDPELVRSFRVERDEATGRTLAELALPRRTGCYVTRLHRGDFFTVPTAETELEKGDHLLVKGRLDELREFARIVGPEIYDEDLRQRMPPGRRVQVVSSAYVGRTLLDVQMPQRFGCLVTGIERGGVHIEPAAALELERGDVVEVVGRRGSVRAVAEELGRFESPSNETDIAVYAGGICLGLLLGNLSLAGIGFTFRLGTAGGLLLMGVLLGRFRRIGPFSANVPASARQLVRDLGILLFVAETGVLAGESAFTGIRGVVLPTLLSAVAVTSLPVVVAVVVGRRVLGMRAVDVWGSVGGGMTSSAALVSLRRAADGDAPALSYAASYAVASVLVTVAGQVVVLLL